ncbi:aminoglycoside phosphotransferase [Herbidospora galbida]|uniref:Glucosamine kinase n=1 Tax=Herbidospora galbida TaxID=2575442 RepID=A0A4U3MBH2_9ACTN|nr:aminoglycoside phosphotransferase [Herbidospora galbida]TKK84956.1 aminoglycoside phosphotransferase [Herbidospora galbida]
MESADWALPGNVVLRLGDELEAGPGVTEQVLRNLGAAPAPFAVREMRPLPDFPAGERAITVDQTHRSVVVGEKVIVKWFPHPSEGPHPGLEMLTHLAEAGFTRTAEPYAAIFCGDALAGLATAYLPGARDGWEWCAEEAAAGRTAFAAEIGTLAADLHLAMTTPSEVVAEPVRLMPATDAWSARAARALDEALALTTDETDAAWLADHVADLRRELAPLQVAGETQVMRVHGDLHVGQIIEWEGGFSLIDFDGNPTVPDASPYQPAARDLAQLVISVENAGQVAIKRRGADPQAISAWVWGAREGLENAYTRRLEEAGRADLLDRSLLRPFEAEQLCRELIYAGRFLERWRYAPMGVLRTWF